MRMMVCGGAAAAAAVVTAGAVMAQADGTKAGVAALPGGLAVANGSVERQAVPGAANTLKVTNNSTKALAVAVNARPWTQSSSGQASPNRRSTLSNVGISESAFTLAPGDSRDVTVTLKSAPRGYQYGALEIIGLPTNLAKRKGIVTGYRLVGALRYKPATPTYALKVGAAKVKSKMVTLSVKNSGNTAEPVSGTVRLKGPLGTRQASVKAMRLLPGKQVSIALMSAKRLQPGRYNAIGDAQAGQAARQRDEEAANHSLAISTSMSIASLASGAPQSSSEAGEATL